MPVPLIKDTRNIDRFGDCQYDSISRWLPYDKREVKYAIAWYIETHWRTKRWLFEQLAESIFDDVRDAFMHDQPFHREDEPWYKRWMSKRPKLKSPSFLPTLVSHMCDGIRNPRDFWGSRLTLVVASAVFKLRIYLYSRSGKLLYVTKLHEPVEAKIYLYFEDQKALHYHVSRSLPNAEWSS